MNEDNKPIAENVHGAQVDAITPPPFDGLLQIVASLVSDEGNGLPVTLSVNGMLISGNIISAPSYFSQISKIIGSSIYDDDAPGKKPFESQISGLAPKPPEGTLPEAAKIRFIHLKDTKFLSASGEVMNLKGSVLWRGRVSDVSGWSYGAFSQG